MIEKILNSDNWENFLVSLQIMWKGMLAIFIVLLIITLIVVFLTKFEDITARKNAENKKK